ncbi:hypothetical protein LTR15_010098 [Elasticomyces elasticus]|nr:hypothetical protein LTR15_010098 [Elasticomyces elasticus]
MATPALMAGSSDNYAMMGRPQIGIDRLPVRRPSTIEKEAMNCKSCRKRKVRTRTWVAKLDKANVWRRSSATDSGRPAKHVRYSSALACTAVDAIPKKRGPKTDVLEALLKRVNGLEKRLKDEKKSDSPEPGESVGASSSLPDLHQEGNTPMTPEGPQQQQPAVGRTTFQQPLQSAQHPQAQTPAVPAQEVSMLADALLNTYFARVHGAPFHILDEPATRQRLRDGSLPRFLMNSIYAVGIRYATHLCGGHAAAVRYSQEYATQARSEIDVDEPSIEHLQALLLLTMANFQAGKGKKSYMLLTHAISMAFALSLHRELPHQLRIAPSEREGRRKLFWSCYLMDRFTVSGSKRPSLISDESIYLRLPAWLPPGSQSYVDGTHFPNGSNLPGAVNTGQGSGAMLVEIVRVLGVTNRYLAAGGVKGDSHFPWHAGSTLSRIRADLDSWAANTQESFMSLEALFGQPDSSTLVLSKLIYHTIHCLVYRPFLPVDLTELSGTGQHQSWAINATNLCFLHANAIAELVEIGKGTSIVDWPSFVGYCICTAGTIHVHGTHYMSPRDGDVYTHSAEFLSREMVQLHELSFVWAGVQHQRETLQSVYASHSQLVQALAANPIRFSPVFQNEGFLDRYPGSYIDGAHCSFTDVDPDATKDISTIYTEFGNGTVDAWRGQPAPSMLAPPQTVPTNYMTQNEMPSVTRKAKRRRTTAPMLHQSSMGEASSFAPFDPRLSHDTYVPNAYYQPTHQHYPEQQHQQQQPTPLSVQNGTYNPAIGEQPFSHGPLQVPTFGQSGFSPSFNFSPLPQHSNVQNTGGDTSAQPAESNVMLNEVSYHPQSGDYQTPGGFSQSADSAHTDPLDRDPFLNLLEQLAQNDGNLDPGQTDLDFMMNEQG